MPIKAKTIKRVVLKPAKKIGVVVLKDSDADKAINSTARVSARLFNDSEKLVSQAAQQVKSQIEVLRAKVHEATAPKRK